MTSPSPFFLILLTLSLFLALMGIDNHLRDIIILLQALQS